jgi:hypothetical protein
MKNKAIIVAITIGTLFSMSDILKAKTITCPVTLDISKFYNHADNPTELNYYYYYVGSKHLNVNASYEYEGVVWKGFKGLMGVEEANEEGKYSLVSANLIETDIKEKSPSCTYQFVFDGLTKGGNPATLKVSLEAVGDYRKCTISGANKNIFKCR